MIILKTQRYNQYHTQFIEHKGRKFKLTYTEDGHMERAIIASLFQPDNGWVGVASERDIGFKRIPSHAMKREDFEADADVLFAKFRDHIEMLYQ